MSAVSERGAKLPSAWFRPKQRGSSARILLGIKTYGDSDTAAKVVWNDWFFPVVSAPPSSTRRTLTLLGAG